MSALELGAFDTTVSNECVCVCACARYHHFNGRQPAINVALLLLLLAHCSRRRCRRRRQQHHTSINRQFPTFVRGSRRVRGCVRCRRYIVHVEMHARVMFGRVIRSAETRVVCELIALVNARRRIAPVLLVTKHNLVRVLSRGTLQ